MKYLKQFNQASEYEAYMKGEDVVLPNVSYVKDGEVYYNPNNAISYPVHINFAEYTTESGGWYIKGEPSIALLFEAIWPICREHFTEWIHPSESTAFDVSAYGTWDFRNSGYINSNAYAVHSSEQTYCSERNYEDSKGNIYDHDITPLNNVIKCDSIYTYSSGGEAIKRYTTSDGKHFYTLWSD